MNIVIREANSIDIENIAYIEEECFSTPWSAKSLFESFSHTPWHFFVAECDGRVVGYGGVYLILDEGQISNIAVLPAFRGKQIGFKILDRIITLCKNEGCAKITLELRKSNTIARSLYEKCGFVAVGERPNFYSSPCESAILMDKSL
ncbi:MAG: ribosomal protein S18-alanine N-acetyltransferase [Clostridia bacterium]|nr:ribosomal protein S18-alanine N-acetyltransferase [Clostridia bacterium]